MFALVENELTIYIVNICVHYGNMYVCVVNVTEFGNEEQSAQFAKFVMKFVLFTTLSKNICLWIY